VVVARPASLLRERLKMVDRTILGAGIDDPSVLRAMRTVPREAFYPEGFERSAYRSAALLPWAAEALTEPLALARMLEALELRPDDRVLEIGTGTGYGAAVLSRRVSEVCSVERQARLCVRAGMRLEQLGYDNVRILHGDGFGGWPDHAPYDGILVSASAPFVPPPLLQQLAEQGRLVMPVGIAHRTQRIVQVRRGRRHGEDQYRTRCLPVRARFIPLRRGTSFSGLR
jgi:protein-L-isoaspartate(D-aspartate) O-methyltransferase